MSGVSAGRIERLRRVFAENFELRGEVGAAAAVWGGGREIVELHAGFRDVALTKPWESDTMVLIWSATKGLASACVLHALEARAIPAEARVAEFWPEFGRNGKEAITVAQVLSHRAGLGALDEKNLTLPDHEGVARAIESQTPLWTPGDGHGYGARTFGFLADEMVRRLAGGVPLGEYWRTHFGEPLGLDLWIGLPESLHARVAQMLAPRSGCDHPDEAFIEAMADPASLTRLAFTNPSGLASASMMNSPVARSASLPSLGGIGSACALAKFYAMLAAGGEWDGRRYFSERSLHLMTHTLSQGFDRVLRVETAFSAGFMRDPVDVDGVKIRATFGPSARAFGHPGAGGSLAFADPDAGIGFAYVMNQMGLGVLPGARARGLVEALFGD